MVVAASRANNCAISGSAEVAAMRDVTAKEKRVKERFPRNAKVKVAWPSPSGVPIWQSGRCVDVSESGMLLRADKAIPSHTLVRVESVDLNLFGPATVRHCTRAGLDFRIGLEFSGGLKWKAIAPGPASREEPF
ncbi:MAG: PilZ domain-containing protein [Acidobacteria bacterium]|nr:PilZ domain-containing protein [Acidobacteriota bacterium]